MESFKFILNPQNKDFVVEGPYGVLKCTLDLPQKYNASTADNVGKARLAVLCHGLFSDRNTGTLKVLSRCLLNPQTELEGVVRFDFHGNGESGGWDLWSFGGYEEEAKDLRAVVEFLESNNCEVTLIAGHSRAGTVVELYARIYPEKLPKVLIVFAGRLDLSAGTYSHFNAEQIMQLNNGETVELIEKKTGVVRKVTPQCIERRRKLDMPKVLAELAPGPNLQLLVLIHSDSDQVVPYRDAERSLDILDKLPHKTFSGELSPRSSNVCLGQYSVVVGDLETMYILCAVYYMKLSDAGHAIAEGDGRFKQHFRNVVSQIIVPALK